MAKMRPRPSQRTGCRPTSRNGPPRLEVLEGRTLPSTTGGPSGVPAQNTTAGQTAVVTPDVPVLAPIANQTVAHTQSSLQVRLSATDPGGNSITYSAAVADDNPAFDLQQVYQFKAGGYFTAGTTAYVLVARANNSFGNPYYLLSSQGGLYAYDGSGSYAHTFAGVTPIAQLGSAVFDDPTQVLDAQAPAGPAPDVGVSVNGNVLTLTPPTGFLGSFKVTVTADDGSGTAQQSFLVNVVDNAPTLAASGAQSLAYNKFPLQLTLGATDADGDPVTYSAQVVGSSAAYALEQQYLFQGVGYQVAGVTAYVLHSNQPGPGVNGYYLVRADGGLYAYDGSSNYWLTFAKESPIARLGAATYQNPSLLLSAAPPVDYQQLSQLMSQYSFQADGYVTAGVSAFVFQSSQPGPGVNGFYLLRPDGTLYAYDGAATYAETFAANKPLATLDPSVYVTPSLLTNATVSPTLYAQLYQLQQQYQFQGDGTFTAGTTAYVLHSNTPGAGVGGFYLLRSDGALFAYDGSSSYTATFDNGTPVAQLGSAVYSKPSLLLNAEAPEAPVGVTASVSGNALTVNTPALFAGTFGVAVTASDGILSTTQTFAVTSTDAPPVLAPVSNVTTPRGSQVQVTLGATDANNLPLTYSAQVTGNSSLAYSLMQQYQFKGIGYVTAGDTGYVLHTDQPGPGVGGYYLLRSDGALFAYDGSSSYTTLFANATPLAQLGAATFQAPALLTGAAPAANPAVGVSFNGNVLTLTQLGPFVGTYQVTVTASDGMLTSSQSFQVTVT